MENICSLDLSNAFNDMHPFVLLIKLIENKIQCEIFNIIEKCSGMLKKDSRLKDKD